LDPKRAIAYYNKGLILDMLDNPKQAIEYYKMAARLDSKQAKDILRDKKVSW